MRVKPKTTYTLSVGKILEEKVNQVEKLTFTIIKIIKQLLEKLFNRPHFIPKVDLLNEELDISSIVSSDNAARNHFPTSLLETCSVLIYCRDVSKGEAKCVSTSE